LITYGDVALEMRDSRNWSCGASVVVVVASRRGSRRSCLGSVWPWLASFLVHGQGWELQQLQLQGL
jgi:hypothetical protein